MKAVLGAGGPGKFDAELVIDGKAFRPDGKTAATLLPPAFGLAGVNLHTYTGWGSVPHWNAFVANLEMHGKGTFSDPRLDDAAKFPVAAACGFGHVRANARPDHAASCAALHLYQLGAAGAQAAGGKLRSRGRRARQELFNGRAGCARCHVPPLFTEPGWKMHTAAEIGIDDFQAKRSPDERYRTTPLAGLSSHRRAASITTAASRSCGTWSTTTTLDSWGSG